MTFRADTAKRALLARAAARNPDGDASVISYF